jgi:hypothetical protein
MLKSIHNEGNSRAFCNLYLCRRDVINASENRISLARLTNTIECFGLVVIEAGVHECLLKTKILRREMSMLRLEE